MIIVPDLKQVSAVDLNFQEQWLGKLPLFCFSHAKHFLSFVLLDDYRNMRIKGKSFVKAK